MVSKLLIYISLWWKIKDSKEIRSVSLKGNHPDNAKAPMLWPPDTNSQLFWKRPLCWGRLRAEGEGGNRGWDGWMASPTQWMWVWANSGIWWRTGEPDVLQSMGSWVKHNLVTTATILLQKVVCLFSSHLHADFNYFIYLLFHQRRETH